MPASQLVRVIHVCEHPEWHDLTHWPIRGLHITQIMQRLREQTCTTCRQGGDRAKSADTDTA